MVGSLNCKLGYLYPDLPLLWKPPPARFCDTETRVSLAHEENTKVYVIKEPKLLVQMMDGVADQNPRRVAFELQFGQKLTSRVIYAETF